MPAQDKKVGKLTANGEERILNVTNDPFDLRDRYYEPTLQELRITMPPPPMTSDQIIDQKKEGSCTGCALAAVINLQNHHRYAREDPSQFQRVSARMLYEMAKFHDEWPDELYEGSSLRGAIKGFFNNGVCTEDEAPLIPFEEGWKLTPALARSARNVGLGAYYRLRPSILDYHAALNEVGAILVSANTHSGWKKPPGKIGKSPIWTDDGHAFAVVGYDATGFFVLNSWGAEWGNYDGIPGIAHWTYNDWAKNVIDAWVLRLAVPTPEAFKLTNRILEPVEAGGAPKLLLAPPRRNEIIGHYIHVDDGNLVNRKRDRYWITQESIEDTAVECIRNPQRTRPGEPEYKHLMFYFHGGLNGPKASARRIAAMKDGFKRNGIYPMHLMWETGFLEELKDLLSGILGLKKGRVGAATDYSDWLLEKASRGLGKGIWNQMKLDGAALFLPENNGKDAFEALLQATKQAPEPLKVHLVAHSAGSIPAGHLLDWLNEIGFGANSIASCSLMAPACTMDFYDRFYRPALADGGPLEQLVQYNLIDKREREDNVGPYRKSLLYFVSRAFETERNTPILGMEEYENRIGDRPGNHTLYYAGRQNSRTRSKDHGGFDNDHTTMNNVLATILGHKPKHTTDFTKSELEDH